MSNLDFSTFNFNDVSVDEKALDRSKFCQIWPKVREGLEILQKVVKNPVLKLAVQALIEVGDRFCG